MGDMPELISKGPILKKLERRYRNPKLLRKRLEILKNLPPWPQGSLAAAPSGILTIREQEHLYKDWFCDTGFWPDLQPVEPILRQGLIAAMEVALRDPDTEEDRPRSLPIDLLWLCGVGPRVTSPEGPFPEGRSFEVSIFWTDQQVNLIILTPPPPVQTTPPDRFLTERDNGFIIKRVNENESDEIDQPKESDRRLVDENDREKGSLIIRRRLRHRPEFSHAPPESDR